MVTIKKLKKVPLNVGAKGSKALSVEPTLYHPIQFEQTKLWTKSNDSNHSKNHGCQNPNLDPTILQFYNPTCPKRSGSFKDLYDHSRSVGSYDFDDPKRH